MEAERTAAIGVQLNVHFNDDIQKLRNNLTKGNIKFAENRLTMTMTIINVKHSDFDNASKIITDTGFKILN
jgi:hypothetical protein|tara:strand:- start:1964 stop:2176 length:213 start_codon:yes stop_codon:yes gene_type:complete